MKSKFILLDNVSDVLEFKASLITNIWHGIRGTKKYKIKLPENVCSIIPYIFSSSSNEYWGEGVPKKREKLNLKEELYGYWEPFKEGLTIKGTIIDNEIHINWKLQQTISKHEYERYNHKAIRNFKNGNRGINFISTETKDTTE